MAEVVSWGTKTLHAHGLGAYIADAVSNGDFRKVVLGTAVMSFFRGGGEPDPVACPLTGTPNANTV